MAVTLVAYSRSLTVGFLSDDFVLLELRDFSAGWRQGTYQLLRVLPVLLLQALDGVGPSWSPGIAHLVSLTLHVANGALLYAIALRLRLEPVAAVLAAALFLLFPASPEAVVWASGLQDVLMTTASLGFVLATLDARHPAVLLGCVLDRPVLQGDRRRDAAAGRGCAVGAWHETHDCGRANSGGMRGGGGRIRSVAPPVGRRDLCRSADAVPHQRDTRYGLRDARRALDRRRVAGGAAGGGS